MLAGDEGCIQTPHNIYVGLVFTSGYWTMTIISTYDSVIYLDMFPQKEAAKITAMLSRKVACPYSWQCHLTVLLL